MICSHVLDSNIAIELPIYDLRDVIAVLESKTYGIYSLYNGRSADTENEFKRNFSKCQYAGTNSGVYAADLDSLSIW